MTEPIKLTNPLQEYVRQLQETYKSKLYYFTLIGTMSLIDTCAALNSPDGETKGSLFRAWFSKYLPQYAPVNHHFGDMTGFSAEECYKFRCRLVHQGRAEIDAKTSDPAVKTGKIAFHVEGSKIHCSNGNGVYYLDIENFMNDVIHAVQDWLTEKIDEPHVQVNLSKTIALHKDPPNMGLVGSSDGFYIY